MTRQDLARLAEFFKNKKMELSQGDYGELIATKVFGSRLPLEPGKKRRKHIDIPGVARFPCTIDQSTDTVVAQIIKYIDAIDVYLCDLQIAGDMHDRGYDMPLYNLDDSKDILGSMVLAMGLYDCLNEIADNLSAAYSVPRDPTFRSMNTNVREWIDTVFWTKFEKDIDLDMTFRNYQARSVREKRAACKGSGWLVKVLNTEAQNIRQHERQQPTGTMTDKEFKRLESIYAEAGLVLLKDQGSQCIVIREEYTGEPLDTGRTLLVLTLVPCDPNEDYRDVVTALIRYADGAEAEVEAFYLYNSLHEWEMIPWDDCCRIASEFCVRMNAAADVLSAAYGIERQPELLTMGGLVLDWCNYEVYSGDSEPYDIDEDLTFAQYEGLTETERVAACGGDRMLAEEIDMTVEARRRRLDMADRSEQLADDLLTMLRRGSEG